MIKSGKYWDPIREGNNIIITKMSHPANISYFIKAIKYGIKEGYKDFIIDLSQVKAVFPNVCVPLAGIIEFYIQKGYSFDFLYPKESDYLINSSIAYPKPVIDNSNELSIHPFDTVWKFGNSTEVTNLVDEFVKDISQVAVCKKGVLDGLTWCLNEVMDNVIQHSNTKCGLVMGQIHKGSKHIAFCIFDCGQGIFNSLKKSIHSPRYPLDAITMSIKEGVTRDKSVGQGNGMWGLHRILESNSGMLTITSSTASYMMKNDNVQTFQKLPCISFENGCTSIDFQIDFEKEISIKNALGGYEPINFRIENIENSIGELNYKLLEKSSGTGTRESGTRIRNEVINLIVESGKTINLDFSGIGVISSSFADELIGKLLVHLGFFYFNQIVRLKGMNDTVQAIVQRSVAQRMSENYFNQELN